MISSRAAMQASFDPSTGVVYGAALNDRRQLAAMGGALDAPPYGAPPMAPVLYIKPRNCFSFGGAPTALAPELEAVQVAATVGVLLARDLTQARADDVRGAIAAACLALDVSEPTDSFYRPAIRQQCRDGFLPLGELAAPPEAWGEIVTTIDGREAHRWSLDRLVRPLEVLAAEVSAFMTLRSGDLLLLGLAADAPRARRGQAVAVSCAGLPSLSTAVIAEVTP